MFLKLKNYKKIVNLKKKFNLSDFDMITNYGLLAGDANLFKTLKIFELVSRTVKIRGDIIEFGIHRGNTSLLIKKILEIFQIKKKLILIDHFKGLIHFTEKDTKKSKKKFFKKFYAKETFVKKFIQFFKFKNINIINKDVTKIKPGFIKNKISLAYFDLDLYLPTINGLNAIKNNIVKNGLIVFDQGDKKIWSERKAIKEFLKQNKNFKIVERIKKRQPDLVVKKIY